MTKILVISAHQDLQQSISNRLILADLEQHFGSDLSVRRLSDLYPDYRIDVAAEEAALVGADNVVLQYLVRLMYFVRESLLHELSVWWKGKVHRLLLLFLKRLCLSRRYPPLLR